MMPDVIGTLTIIAFGLFVYFILVLCEKVEEVDDE